MIELIKASGQDYLFGTFSNRWVDREGQIITDAAHKEYIQFLDNHPERSPSLWFWHIPDMEFANKADWWSYNNGFVSMLWPLTENEAEFIANFSKLFEVGMSHGFTAELDKTGDIIKYRPFEASLLPIDKAANINTSIEILRKELRKMEEKFTVLAQTIGTKKAAEMLKALIEQEAQLEAAEIATKEVTLTTSKEEIPTPEPATVEETEETPIPIVDEAELVQVLQARDAQIEQMIAEQRQAITELQEQLASLNKQLSLAKQLGSSRATLKHYAERIAENANSVIGTEAAKVDGRSALAKSKPKENDSTNNHVLAGILPQIQGGK